MKTENGPVFGGDRGDCPPHRRARQARQATALCWTDGRSGEFTWEHLMLTDGQHGPPKSGITKQVSERHCETHRG